MEKVVALIVSLLLAGAAQACECAFSGLDTAQARTARNVFVFRLTDARAGKDTQVIGTIKVLADVRGKTTAQEVRYSTFYCCGSRLEVGKYYVGFLPANSARFNGNAGNILPLWGEFDRETADNLEAVLRGKLQLEDAFSYGLEEINQIRPPPAPCPKHSRTGR
ncbi:hypothetical protein J2X06_002950 [Lysobacter niastensis]|uniref:Uncharacterized protein n=1 Tax=Lysobacter niastensis TaxID=380629 RepID=A0ABU1WDP4_9GAMM|nr:hypothetical protein [Lysobacter niastensis]MDR7135732.1 hypothetical protein [Lysobacter niastensis]